MGFETLAIIALAVVVVILFFMMQSKDEQTNKKLEMYEKSIEDLNYQTHELEKLLNEMANEEGLSRDEVGHQIVEVSKAEIEKHLHPMVNSLREIQNAIEAFKMEQESRIDRLENRTKEISNLTSSGTSLSNEKMIIAQYSRGRSEAEIAKDLRIGIGEIDLVLKLANLK